MNSRHFVPLLSAAVFFGIVSRSTAQTIYTPYHFVTIAGTAGVTGSADGVGPAAQFNHPQALSVDSAGDVFVADTNNETIRKIVPTATQGVTTWTVSTLAGTVGVQGTADGQGTAAQFTYPAGIYVAGDGTVYVPADNNSTNSINGTFVRQISASGLVSTLVASTIAPPSSYSINQSPLPVYSNGQNAGPDADLFLSTSTEGEAPNGDQFKILGPSQLGLSPADYTQVVEIVLAGNVASEVTFSLLGIGPGSKDGQSPDTSCYFPQGMAIDASNNVYVADTLNDLIRKVTLTVTDGTESWYVTTLGGVAENSGSSDGLGAAARFNDPWGVAVTADGVVYVADAGNNTIRMGTPLAQPTITLQASSQTVANGHTAIFNALATGFPAPAYQWTLNGSTTIPGASTTTDPILMITGSTAADTGTYVCTATNSLGTATTTATLTVITTTVPGYLDNLSGRGAVGLGTANGLFPGFVIAGTGAKSLLLRGVGPGLDGQLSDALSTPSFTMYDSHSVAIATNAGWANALQLGSSTDNVSPQLATASFMSGLGAFTLTAGSADCAMQVSAGVGAYTAEETGLNGSTGIGLVEIYDADVPPLSARLVNISARAPVGTGNGILIAGFVIAGNSAETVLVRGVGPRLASTPFGLSGVLAQPVLTIYSGSTAIYSNTGWNDDPVLADATSAVGAYSYSAGSQDSALLVTLPPGAYTALVSGLNGTTGIGSVEIYEVP